MTLHSVANLIFGMVFTWLVLSMAAMYLQELLAAKLRWRQKMLETTIRNMLVDSAYADQFYNHPLIRSLYSGSGGESKPSYIPANQFAHALIDLLRTSGSEASLIQQQVYKLLPATDKLRKAHRKQAQEHLATILALTRRVLVSEINAADVSLAIQKIRGALANLAKEIPDLQPDIEHALSTIEKQKQQISAALAARRSYNRGALREASIDQIQTGIVVLAVTNPGLKQTLQSLLRDQFELLEGTGDEPISIRSVFESWFNNSMDRLSGWYKRRAQILSIILGILLGTMANIDSLMLAGHLWREPVVGDALAAQAGAYLQWTGGEFQNPTPNLIIQLQDQLYGANLPIGWLGSPVYLLSTGVPEPGAVCSRSPEAITDIYGIMIADVCYPIINAPRPDNTTGWVLKAIGLLITGLATSKGAPFWFDVLNKVINVRLAGVNPSQLQSTFG